MEQTSIAKTVHWQTISDMLLPERSRSQNLKGFDDEFVDIADYILRITHRIWEQKNIGLCFDYYSDYCPVHTLGGYCDSVDVVVKNTLKTIAAFPDRSLIGEDVIYAQEPDEVYYSSHRITSIMTNKGGSEFGLPTGRTGRVTTIADCMCKDNKIFYEWLMRDNSFLIAQLGIDIMAAARFQANAAINEQFVSWINEEFQRTRDGLAMEWQSLEKHAQPYSEFVKEWADCLFNKKMFNQLADFYHSSAAIQWPGGRQATGIAAISGLIIGWLASCPDAKMVIDHLCVTSYDEQRVHIAIRWGVAGTYNGQSVAVSEFTGQAYYVLGASHFELENGLIQREWTVFDEVAALANLMRKLPNNGEELAC